MNEVKDDYACARMECELLVEQAITLLDTAGSIWEANGFDKDRGGECAFESIAVHQMLEYAGITNDALAMACESVGEDAWSTLAKVNAALRGEDQ